MFNLQVHTASARRVVEELPCLGAIYTVKSKTCEHFLQRKSPLTYAAYVSHLTAQRSKGFVGHSENSLKE
jgi:hypothetical protein